MTSYTLHLVVLLVALVDINCDMTFNCQRKGQNCKNGGTCNAEGKCNCDGTPGEGFDCGIPTADKNPDQTVCGCENDGVCMIDLSCICTEAYYGLKCTFKRDVILCLGDVKLIFLYPVGFTDGEAFISGKRNECKFTKTQDATDTTDFLDEWTGTDVNGYFIRVNDDDPTCGAITETVSEDGLMTTETRYVNLQFDKNIITSLDEFLSINCENSMESTNGFIVKTNFTGISFKNITTTTEYKPMQFSANNGDQEIGDATILVGTEITLVFTIPESTGFDAVILTELTASDPADETTTITLVTDRCTNIEAIFVVVSILRTDDRRVVTATLKVFKFVNADNIRFEAIARICKTGDIRCDERTNCPGTLVRGLGRRRREAGSEDLKVEKNIKVTTDPREVTSSSQNRNDHGTCPDSGSTDEVHCLQKTEIITVLALLAATIVILLITCTILTWRLLRTSPKVAEVHPFQYENHSNRSLPRLSPSNF